MVLGVIFDGFGCPEGSLCGFGGSWSPGGFLRYFRTCPWGPRILRTWERVVKGPSAGPRGQTKSKTPASFGLVFQTASSRLQAYKQLPARLNDTILLIQDCNGAPQPDGP